MPSSKAEGSPANRAFRFPQLIRLVRASRLSSPALISRHAREGELPLDIERFSQEERQNIVGNLQEFAERCESVTEDSDDIRQALLPPNSLTFALGQFVGLLSASSS